MGGSSKQTIGYKYFGGMMLAIGNRIEKLIDINPDERGWIMTPENKKALDAGNTSIEILKTDIFGGDNQEGGMGGILDVYTGSQTDPSEYLKIQINEDISAYPNLSYLVFRGFQKNSLTPSLDRGFYWCSMSGMLKDMMLWVKRTRIKNDGSPQWYERNLKGDIVCEIDATFDEGDIVEPTPVGDCTFYYKYTNGCSFSETLVERTWTQNYQSVVSVDPDLPHPKGENIPCPASFSNQPQSSCVSPSEFQRSGYYHFNYKFGGSGVIVVNFEFKVPNAEYAGDIDQYIDFYCNAEYSVDKKFNKNLYVYSIRMKAPANIIATWNVKSAYYKKDEPIGLPWYYEYGLAFMYFYQEPYDSNYENKFFDINPIHKIREILTDYEAMNKDESRINDSNFMLSADRIWSERLGISWSLNEKSCKEALDEILYHIEAGLRINRETGKYEVVLFRDDLVDIDNSIRFNESNIKSIEFDISNLEDSISSINVSYYDRELIKDSSFLLYENGLERTRGYSISENIDFPYFMNRRNAEVVGNWKLKQLSTPTWRGSLKTGIEQARKINKYDVILLSWSSKNIVDLPVRVMNINLGDGINNTVTFDFVEVIPYSNISYSDTSVDEKVDDRLPPQHNLNTAFEMPYFESVQRFGQSQVDLELSSNPEIGYLIASAAKPQNNSLNAQLYTDKATGVYSNMSKAGVVDYCPTLYIDQVISFTETTFKIKDIDSVLANGVSKFIGATSGTWIILNDEIMVYESFDAELMQITVKRGALDTVPHRHTAGTIFFSDEFSGFDNNQYIQSEIVKYQVLTSTPSALQQLELGNTGEVEFNSRAIRPYPPANIKINGEYYPDDIETDLVITWADRNRIQQTGGDIIGWYDGNVTIEQNTSTIIVVLEEDESHNVLTAHNNDVTGTSSYTLPMSALNPETRYLNITAKTKRNGFESYQKFNHILEISQFFSAPYDLKVEYKND